MVGTLQQSETEEGFRARPGSGLLARPLRILMVAPQPFFRPRGTPFSVLHRARVLGEAGCQVDLLTYPFGNDVDLPGLRILRAARVPGVTDVKIGPSLAKLALDVPLAVAARRALAREPYDVVHTHEEAAFFCAGMARRRGILHIYDMHSSLPQQLENFNAFNLGAFKRAFARLEHRVLTTCDGVITICQALADVVARVSPHTPHAMIENTADDAKVFTASAHALDPAVRALSGPVVLYTGTMEAYQGIGLLLEAFQDVAERRQDCSLVLVGGRPEQVDRYRAEAAHRGLSQRTVFVGQVDPDVIPAYLEAATIIVSPRCSGTNTPLKIYGYLRSGKPIVATNMRTHTQTLHQGVAELTEPSAAGLASGLLRLLEDPARGERLGEEAKRLADADYSDAAYCDKVLGFYNSVLEHAGRDRPRAAPSVAGPSTTKTNQGV